MDKLKLGQPLDRPVASHLFSSAARVSASAYAGIGSVYDQRWRSEDLSCCPGPLHPTHCP
eukprot:368609-Amphidinium_carterae.1